LDTLEEATLTEGFDTLRMSMERISSPCAVTRPEPSEPLNECGIAPKVTADFIQSFNELTAEITLRTNNEIDDKKYVVLPDINLKRSSEYTTSLSKDTVHLPMRQYLHLQQQLDNSISLTAQHASALDDQIRSRKDSSLHLRDINSLPYIRVKKKVNLPNVSAAPYLKVLKHRRKKKKNLSTEEFSPTKQLLCS